MRLMDALQSWWQFFKIPLSELAGWKGATAEWLPTLEKASASDPGDPGDFDRGGRHHDPQWRSPM